MEVCGNLNIRDHMKADTGVIWAQKDMKEKGPMHSEHPRRMSVSHYSRKYGEANNLLRAAQSHQRGFKS